MFPRFDDLDRYFKRISSPVLFHKGSIKEAKLGNDYSILCLKKCKIPDASSLGRSRQMFVASTKTSLLNFTPQE